jgi:hypothetical protein
MTRKIFVSVATSGRIIRASCQCGERKAVAAAMGWIVQRQSYGPSSAWNTTTTAWAWILRCPCMKAPAPESLFQSKEHND